MGAPLFCSRLLLSRRPSFRLPAPAATITAGTRKSRMRSILTTRYVTVDDTDGHRSLEDRAEPRHVFASCPRLGPMMLFEAG